MSKPFRQSHVSSSKYNHNQRTTPNYSIQGNPLSSHTGYQYSHMHQSLDADDIEAHLCDDMIDYNMYKVHGALENQALPP